MTTKLVSLNRLASLVSESRDDGELPVLTLDLLEPAAGRIAAGVKVPVSHRPEGGVARVDRGDVLFGKLRPYLAKSLLVTTPSYASTELLALRPRHDLDSRLLAYLVQSGPFLHWTVATSEGTKMPRTSWEKVGNFKLSAPSVKQQRAIADFLDTETARINTLITKKRRMIDLVEEKRQSAVEVVVHTEDQTPLRRIAELLPGYMFASDDFAPDADGPLLLRGVNVSIGSVRWNEAVRLYARSAIPDRYRLVEGDVVVGMDRPFIAGGTRVARIDKASEGALLVQRVCRVRACAPSAAVLIEHVLRSQRFAAHVESDLTGVSVPHLSDEQIGSMLVPVFDQSDLPAIASRLVAVGTWAGTLTRCLKQQLTLLREHRQALITAAVTGELDIPGFPA